MAEGETVPFGFIVLYRVCFSKAAWGMRERNETHAVIPSGKSDRSSDLSDWKSPDYQWSRKDASERPGCDLLQPFDNERSDFCFFGS